MRTQADAEPFLTALKILALGAGGIGGVFYIPFIFFARILHHGDKGLTVLGVKRLCKEVGVDDCGAAQWVLFVSFIVVAVAQFEAFTEGFDHAVEIALAGL